MSRLRYCDILSTPENRRIADVTPISPQSLQLGNGKYETTQFNSRLQPTQIGLGTSATDTSLLRIEFSYGTTANNGNVLSQTITVPGVSYTFNQSYSYDELNRISSATETYNGSQNWKQEFSYDRFGNRSFVTGTGHTTTLGSCTTMCNPTFSSTTNRITSTGYSFDSVGNMTADPSGRTFTYDAENKQTEVDDAAPSVLGQYSYDGDGKRVEKLASTGDDTVFVYDAFGKLIEEFTAAGPLLNQSVQSSSPICYVCPSVTSANVSYVYARSRLLSTEDGDGPHYLTADHLGSPRINTDASGNVTARHDYMPFGEEISTSQRTSSVGYPGSPDGVRKQFTGYERDTETGLDFAQARMYSFSIGRFTVPDPFNGSSSAQQPQSYNRFAYVGNNPLVTTDPGGLQWFSMDHMVDGVLHHSYQWFDKGAKVPKGWHIYMGSRQIPLNDGTNRILYLNEAGPNSKGRNDYEKNGWVTQRAPDVMDQTFHNENDSMEGSKDVTLDLVFLFDGAASLPKGIAEAGAALSRAEVDATATVIKDPEIVQYSLRATEDGFYPVMTRGFKDPTDNIFLKEGEVWKFGQTINPATRYSGKFLKDNGLAFSADGSSTSLRQALDVEKQTIMRYETQFGRLPPGNKIRR